MARSTEITEAQFEMIVKSALGSIDYEFILIAMSDYFFRRAKELKTDGLENEYDRTFKKGEKLLDHICAFRRLNKEVSDEIHSIA